MIDDLVNTNIENRASFINFLSLLRKDLTINSEEWGNITLEDFLEAMESYTEDIQGYYNNTNQNVDADQASWKVFADILMGSRIYD
jgi:molybdate-binding protein